MGAYTLLQDLTVATNSTSVVLNDFGTITKDDFVKVVTTFINVSTLDNDISLYANTATTETNYHRQGLIGFGTSVVAARQNISRFDHVIGSTTSTTVGYIKLSENDRFNYFSNNTRNNTSGVELLFNYVTSSGATFTSGITTLTFTGLRTNGIGTGSRIQIYRLDAVKIADISVTSNTTQVDISNLSIDKDSEYLLCTEVVGSVSGDVLLTPNDLTTVGDYRTQLIQGDGSGTGAGRFSLPRIGTGSSNSTANSLNYVHIKLSNIGAFTTQSYEMQGYGTSSLQILNWFASSLAENITSITKLNVRSSGTNGIGTGSRFILYKLYE